MKINFKKLAEQFKSIYWSLETIQEDIELNRDKDEIIESLESEMNRINKIVELLKCFYNE